MKQNFYYPTLVIGIGGFGVRAVRWLKSIGKTHQDPILGSALEGQIELLGIDLDPHSNAEEQVRDWQDLQSNKQIVEQVPNQLATLGANWLYLPSNESADYIRRIWSALYQANWDDPCQAQYEHFKGWLPLPGGQGARGFTEDELLNGEGTGGWRFRGRVLFFQFVARVVRQLQPALQRVRANVSSSGRVRILLVNSLAGGTGAGMFWDLAIVLRALEPHALINGFFCLNRPFETQNARNHIRPNVYACIKEISHQDQWSRYYRLQYPSVQELKLQNTFLGGPPLNGIYLYQGFPLGNLAKDSTVSVVDVSAYRLAHTLRSFCRADIDALAGQADSNLWLFTQSGASPDSRKAEKGCFGTIGTYWFPAVDLAALQAPAIRVSMEKLGEKPNPLPKMAVNEFFGKLGIPYNCSEWPSYLKLMQSGNSLELADSPPGVMAEQGRDIIDFILEAIQASGREAVKACDKEDSDYVLMLKIFNDESYLGKYFGDCFFETLKAAKDKKEPNVNLDFNVVLLKPRLDKFWKVKCDDLIKKIGVVKKEAESFDEKICEELENFIKFLGPIASIDNVCLPVKIPLFDIFKTLEISSESDMPTLFSRFSPRILWELQMRYVKEAARCFENISREQISLDTEDIDKVRRYFARDHVKSIIEKLEELKKFVAEKIKDNNGAEKSGEDFSNAVKKKVRNLASFKDLNPAKVYSFEWAVLASYKQSSANWINGLADCLFKEVSKISLGGDPGREKLMDLLKQQGIFTGFSEDGCDSSVREWITSLESSANPSKATINNVYSKEAVERLRKLVLGCFSSSFLGLTVKGIVKKEIEHSQPLADAFYALLQDGFKHVFIAMEKKGLGTSLSLSPDALKQLLQYAQPKAFQNATGNQDKHSGIVAAPFYLGSHKSTSNEEILAEIENIKTAAASMGSIKPSVLRQETEIPIIFSFDQFRTAQEIEQIGPCFEAYLQSKVAKKKAFYHADRRWQNLSEPICKILSGRQHCGHSDCNADISHLLGKATICDGCGRPILNHCGNADCYETNLSNLVETYRRAHDGKTPVQCPACEGFIKTYWWRCDQCAHRGYLNPSDKETCSQCMEEVATGRRDKGQVSKRPDLRQGATCPGCKVVFSSKDQRYELPETLRNFVFDGVNGHEQATFKALMKEHFPGKEPPELYECPRGSMGIHALIPHWKESDRPNATVHLIYRLPKSGRFVCTFDEHLSFWNCSVCDYPIEAGLELENCPRCLSTLVHCPYCSDTHHRYVQSDSDNYNRCTKCLNFLELEKLGRLDTMLSPSGFCPNIYGCRAGLAIQNTNTDLSFETCQACPEANIMLLPNEKREAWLKACYICRNVVLAGSSPEVESDQEKFECCPICSAKQAEAKAWLEGNSTSCPWPKDDGIKVLKALHQHIDMQHVHKQVLAIILGNPTLVSRPPSFRSLSTLFEQNAPTTAILYKRLSQLDRNRNPFKAKRKAR